ncbi:DUF4347 domain-containing protein [Corallococcus exiguus]|nr:DUF4347 domain-containing protein [Corallococcus exiguus]
MCRLDLFGHGAPGSLILGDKQAPLMTANRSTWGRLLMLKDFLTPGAEVRLLGCETGIHPEGFDVLQGLSQQLGCTVWGAKTRIDWSDFREMGFDPKLVKDLLVSSAEMESPISATSRPGDSMKAGLEELERLRIGVPSGYEPEGYAPMPASILDEVWENQEQKVTVTVRGQRRIIVITASPGRHFLLRWLAPRTAPSLDALKPQLNIY